MSTIHPKVRVPAIVGTVLTVVLAVLSAVGAGVPSVAPVAAAAVTILQFVSGYLTYS